MDDYKLSIGKRIVAARKARGWEQLDLCARMGWDRTSRLSNYETGQREPDAKTIKRMAHHLGVTAGHLMFDEPLGMAVDTVEAETIRMLRELSADTRDKLIADINWHFNQQYPGVATRVNPYPNVPLPGSSRKLPSPRG
jgi:transcriptional regulator with XRE-family HTH domain